jgi:sterol desaturase/sphingolipid hydroxylase (fatty acid hydroxylase superfamily)
MVNMLVLILHILGYDIWFYISHILLHTRPLWRFHKIHHEIIHPKFTDTYTGHWIEGPFKSLGFLLPIIFQNFDLASFIFALLFVNLRGLMRHDDRTIWLIGNHHLLHHQYFNCNFGEYWLDKLFRTSIKDHDKVKKGLIYV